MLRKSSAVAICGHLSLYAKKTYEHYVESEFYHQEIDVRSMSWHEDEWSISFLIVLEKTFKGSVIYDHFLVNGFEHFGQKPSEHTNHWHRVVGKHNSTNINSFSLDFFLHFIIVDWTSTNLTGFIVNKLLDHGLHSRTVHHQRNMLTIRLGFKILPLFHNPLNIAKVCGSLRHLKYIIGLVSEGNGISLFENVAL